jgi:hypothetical protein
MIGGFWGRGRFSLQRTLIVVVVIAVVWCIGALATGYHFNENAADRQCGAHILKVDFVIPLYKTDQPCP